MEGGLIINILLHLSLTLTSVDGFLELVNGRGNLQSLEEDSLLPLDPDVFGPSHESREISLGLDVASDSEVAGVLLEKGTLALAASGLGGGRSHNDLLAFGCFLDLLSTVACATSWSAI